MAKKAKNIAAVLTNAAKKAVAALAKANKNTAAPKTAAAKVTKSTAKAKAKRVAAAAAASRQQVQLPDLFPTAKKQNAAPQLPKFNAAVAGQGRADLRGRSMLNTAAKTALGDAFTKAYKNPAAAQYLPLSADFRISSPYGVDRVTHRHSGIDLAVAEGTKVAAVKSGTVSFAGWGNGYGYRVVIDHPDGTQTTYNHLSDIGVKVGDSVIAGRAIALSGNTGNSTGPHLHFEVKKDGRYVDPELYFDFGNGLKAADTAYTSQMAAAASAEKATAKSTAASPKTAAGANKKTTASLPKMNFTAPEFSAPGRPAITAYKAKGRSNVADYFENPLVGLIPSYRIDSLRSFVNKF